MKSTPVKLPPLRSAKLLDQLRKRIRFLHYSVRTEQAYVYWVRAFIRFHGLRHPARMGRAEVEAFLSWLANERHVSVSTHKQALSALLFLYARVLLVELPWLKTAVRPRSHRRLPVVLGAEEVSRVLAVIESGHRLFAQLLYGTGMRISEALMLRVKDIEFDRRAIVIRAGKGGKDRVVMLPESLVPALRDQLALAAALWAEDRREGRGGRVEARDYWPGAGAGACCTAPGIGASATTLIESTQYSVSPKQSEGRPLCCS